MSMEQAILVLFGAAFMSILPAAILTGLVARDCPMANTKFITKIFYQAALACFCFILGIVVIIHAL